MNIIEFLSAFGLGALVTALVQAWLSHKSYISKRNFQEKKESYVGYLDAIYKSDIKNTVETGAYLAHWKNRIELIGSKEVIYLCNRFFETNPINDKITSRTSSSISRLKRSNAKRLECKFRHLSYQ